MIWYLDDETIFGRLDLLERLLQRMVDLLPCIGLRLNRTKSLVVTSGDVSPETGGLALVYAVLMLYKKIKLDVAILNLQ